MHASPCAVHPVKQIFHKFVHKLCRRGHENTPVAVEHSFFPRAEKAGLINNVFRHYAVQRFQIVNAVWIYFRKPFIGFVCVFNLLYFPLRAYYHPPAYNVAHLPQG